jgi:IMP dehydrogenase/GMP reductase
MRRPRIEDYDPNAKLPELASPLDGMPVIGKPPQKHNAASPAPLPQAPVVQQEQEKEQKQNGTAYPVPDGVRVGVPPPVPLVPKVKRVIRQRQPFDIYEDQYERLKQIKEAEEGFVNGRGMSQMVREAIDNYLLSLEQRAKQDRPERCRHG